MRNVRIDSGVAHRSVYRWRYRVSTSLKPACFSGGGTRHLPIGRTDSAHTVTSPVRVFISGPSAITRSPRSVAFATPNPVSSHSRLLTATWNDSADSSRRFIQISLPLSRCSTTRPATRTRGRSSTTAGQSASPASGLSFLNCLRAEALAWFASSAPAS